MNQDPEETRGGRAQLAPTENPVSLERADLLDTGGMKARLDLKDPKDREESKELRETEASRGRGEKMV